MNFLEFLQWNKKFFIFIISWRVSFYEKKNNDHRDILKNVSATMNFGWIKICQKITRTKNECWKETNKNTDKHTFRMRVHVHGTQTH